MPIGVILLQVGCRFSPPDRGYFCRQFPGVYKYTDKRSWVVDRNHRMGSMTESRDLGLGQNDSHHALIDIFFGGDSLVTSLHVMMACAQHQNKDAIDSSRGALDL